MNYINLFSLIPVFLSLFFVAYIFGLRFKSEVNRSALLFLVTIFLMALADFFRFIPIHPLWETFFMHLAGMTYMTLGFFLYNFIMALGGKGKNLLWKVLFLFTFICVILSLFVEYQVMVKSTDGRSLYIQALPPFLPLYFFSSLVPGLIAVVTCFGPLERMRLRERKALLFMRWAILVSFVISVFLIILVPIVLQKPEWYPLNYVGVIIIMSSLFMAMQKYYAATVEIYDIATVSDAVFDKLEIGIAVFDQDGALLHSNTAFFKLLGLVPDLPPDQGRLMSILNGYVPMKNISLTQVELRFTGFSKYLNYAQTVFTKGNHVLGGILLLQDITQKVLTDRESIKNRHLESLGQFAGGIAHDFNNYLTSITTAISLVQTDPAKFIDQLAYAESGALKASKLVNQLLTFARGGTPVKESLSVKDFIMETAQFVVHGSGVKLVLDFSDNLGFFKADRTQISQVLQNIILNSMQAMRNNGEIRLSAGNIIVDESDMKKYGLEAGPYVRIEISDNGPGISQENLERIFDPYFSTKGEGRGLGLPTTLSIVRRHEGCLQVFSRLGEGTRMVILLPASDTNATASEKPSCDTAHKQSLHILLMEDDETIRKMVAVMLEKLGHRVTTAAKGEDALEFYDKAVQDGRKVDLLITDLTVVGGMGGKKLAEEMRIRNSSLPMVVMSGYSTDPVFSDLESHGFCAGLKKPFSMNDLKRVLGQV